MFLDHAAMQSLYGAGGSLSGAGWWSNGAASIGTFGSDLTISLHNDNETWSAGNAIVFGAAIPAPGALGLLGATGLVRIRRRRRAPPHASTVPPRGSTVGFTR